MPSAKMFPVINITLMRCTVLFLLLLSSCAVKKHPFVPHYKTYPEYVINPKPESIILLHTCDVAANKYRKNKTALFNRFLDSILVTAAAEITYRTGIKTEIIRGLTVVPSPVDSSITQLMKTHAATHAIVVDSFDVFFNKTTVKVTETRSGKDREAFYDITTVTDFAFYSNDHLFKKFLMRKNEFYESRDVISGLLATGPNVVVKRRDAWDITYQNLISYLDLFFESRG